MTGLTQQPALRVKSFIDDAIATLLEGCSRYQLDSDSELARRLEELKKRAASHEIVLTVLGEFSAGKTTFINRLLGTDIFQTGLLPTTSVCTYIRYGKSAACEVSLKSGKVLALSPEQVPQYSTDGEHTSQVTSVRVTLPASLLADGLVVVDTPGVNVNIAAHEAITEQAISAANACLFLMDARQPGKKTTTDFLRSINSRIDKFFFVLNRADILDPGEQQEALEYLSNVLTQECGIPNPRVLLLSSAFKEDNLEWGQRFTSFEHDLRNFMEAERDLVICAELARSLDEAIARAERLLVSQHRLAEDELAIRYKTRLPDSELLVENLARTLGAIVAEKKRQLLDGYPAFHQNKCAELHSRLTNCIEAADSKESLAQNVPAQLRAEFETSAKALNAYFNDPLDACFRTCQDIMVAKVQELFRGIRFVEEKRFLRRTTTWFAMALGGGAVAWATTTALSLESGVVIGCVAAFAWLWLEWLYFKHINESRFGTPTLLSLPEALVRHGDMTSGAQLQKYISLQQLSALEANLPEYGKTAARGSFQVARIGMSGGHPVFAIATLGVGFAIAAVTKSVSLVVGVRRKIKDWFGPSLQELKDEMSGKALEGHAVFERNSESAGAEAIALTADAVCMALATNVKEVVQRYRYTLDKLLQSQSSLFEHLERKRRELTSELGGLTSLRGKTAESLQMLRVALGNEATLFPSPETQIPSLAPSALATETLDESLDAAIAEQPIAAGPKARFVEAGGSKHIGLTCKCGQRNVFTVPQEALQSQMSRAVECESCHQQYIFDNGKLFRQDNHGCPEKLIEPKGERAKVTDDATRTGSRSTQGIAPEPRLPMEQVDEPLNNLRRWQIGPHVWVATALLTCVAGLTWLPTFFPNVSRQADGHGSPQASLPPKVDSNQTARLPTPPAETPKASLTDAIMAPWLKSITEVLQRPYTPLPEVPIPEQLWKDVGITPTNEERKGNANSLRLSDGRLPELLVEDTNPDFCGSGSGCPWSIYGLRSEVTSDGRASLKYKSLLESQGGVYVLDSVTNGYRDLLIDGGYGGDVLKFDGTSYKVNECFSHDYKKLDDIHPSDCESVASSIARPARDDVQVSNPVLSPAPQTAVTSFEQQSEPNREAAVRALLAQWVSSFKEKDLQQQVNCYASELEIYYRKRNAPQSFVANNKAHAFGAIATIRQFDLTDINISFLGEESFGKE